MSPENDLAAFRPENGAPSDATSFLANISVDLRYFGFMYVRGERVVAAQIGSVKRHAPGNVVVG
jgi:hypothetical protein